MTLDLEPIKVRAQAATPGPWRPFKTSADHWHVCDAGESVAAIHANDGSDEDTRRPDAEFIAHAREDIPALIAEVERLRAGRAS